MAQRFGGKYSPDSDPDTQEDLPKRGAYHGARTDPAGVRANILFIPAIPLVFMSLNDGAVGMTLGLIAAGLLALAAWLMREGLRAESAYHARKVARRPAFPRKMASSLLTGLGIALAAYKNDPGLVAPFLFGAVTTALHGISFGIDPMRDKGMEGIDTLQQDRVARVVDEAETYLSDMSDAILRAGDRRVETRLEQFQATARELLRTVEEDPRDLAGARKFMTVYLMGARDASVKYADIWSRMPDAQARTDYLALLDDLEQNFAARTRKMLQDDRSDLTVEIEVLRDRLQREGVRLD